MSLTACPVCRSEQLEPLLDLGAVPLFCNVQWPTPSAARAAATGPLRLAACADCGHVCNQAFDAACVAYAPGYENSQHFSAVFRRYAEALADRLVTRHALHGQPIVDIGCGRGDLLRLLCAHSGGRGTGFDPSHDGDDVEGDGQVEIRREHFTPAHARALAPALVCCRHVLEHVADPLAFLAGLRTAMSARPGSVLYLEVPNGRHQLEAGALWDYLYEHISYFSAASLAHALAVAGFEVLALDAVFDGQFLAAEVRVAAPRPEAARRVAADAQALQRAAGELPAKLAHWRQWAAGLRSQGRRAAVWGAGSKGVMFLNLLDLRVPGPVEVVVDQNPAKHGHHVAGTAQRIVAPAALAGTRVDELVLMNPAYRDEIVDQLAGLGIAPQVRVA